MKQSIEDLLTSYLLATSTAFWLSTIESIDLPLALSIIKGLRI